METWSGIETGALWRHAIGVIPLVLVVAGVTRFMPCRPATRHVLWLTVLIGLLVSPLLPQAPSMDLTGAFSQVASLTTDARLQPTQATPDRSLAPLLAQPIVVPHRTISRHGTANEGSARPSRRTRTRPEPGRAPKA